MNKHKYKNKYKNKKIESNHTKTGKEEHDNEGRVITAEFEKYYLVNSYVPNSGARLER